MPGGWKAPEGPGQSESWLSPSLGGSLNEITELPGTSFCPHRHLDAPDRALRGKKLSGHCRRHQKDSLCSGFTPTEEVRIPAPAAGLGL